MLDKDSKTDHKSKAGEVLLSLAGNICPDDKKEAVAKLQLSIVTIGDYLQGRVRNLATAEKLIVFFRETVSRREKLLAGEQA